MLAQSAPRDAALADAGTAESATIYQGLTPQRMARIQRALQRDKLDGWLFFDFRRSDEIAYRLLGLDPGGARSRRWYCLVPAQGQPRKLLHAIEPRALDGVPGSSATYTSWRTRDRELGTLLRGVRRVAMDYSPRNEIPTVARVDGGTLELVRSMGAEIVSSADLVAELESMLTPEELASQARDAALQLLRQRAEFGKLPSGAEVDAAARNVIAKAGFGDRFLHRTGHSIDHHGHGDGVNNDDFETRDTRRHLPDTCFSIEPGIYLAGRFGIRSEIDVCLPGGRVELRGGPGQSVVPALLAP